MKFQTYTGLNSDLRIKIQFQNTLTNYSKSDILKKRLVLLPVDWDENGILFTKRLHTMNKIIGYSYQAS